MKFYSGKSCWFLLVMLALPISSIKLDEIGNEWLYRSATATLLPSKSMVLIQDHLANLGLLDIQVRPMGGGFSHSYFSQY